MNILFIFTRIFMFESKNNHIFPMLIVKNELSIKKLQKIQVDYMIYIYSHFILFVFKTTNVFLY